MSDKEAILGQFKLFSLDTGGIGSCLGRPKEGCRDGRQREGRDSKVVEIGGVDGLTTGPKGCHPTFNPHVRFRADWVCFTLWAHALINPDLKEHRKIYAIRGGRPRGRGAPQLPRSYRARAGTGRCACPSGRPCTANASCNFVALSNDLISASRFKA